LAAVVDGDVKDPDNVTRRNVALHNRVIPGLEAPMREWRRAQRQSRLGKGRFVEPVNTQRFIPAVEALFAAGPPGPPPGVPPSESQDAFLGEVWHGHLLERHVFLPRSIGCCPKAVEPVLEARPSSDPRTSWRELAKVPFKEPPVGAFVVQPTAVFWCEFPVYKYVVVEVAVATAKDGSDVEAKLGVVHADDDDRIGRLASEAQLKDKVPDEHVEEMAIVESELEANNGVPGALAVADPAAVGSLNLSFCTARRALRAPVLPDTDFGWLAGGLAPCRDEVLEP